MEEDPDVVPGGDEGGRDGRATEPEGLLAGRGRGAQHEPVQGALVGLLHVKVAEAAGAGRTTDVSGWSETSRSCLNSQQGWPAPASPLSSTPSCSAGPQGSESGSMKNQDSVDN